MITDRLLGGGDTPEDGDIEQSIADMDERYSDLVEILNGKADPCVCLALNDTGLHFWFNFDEVDPLIDILSGFAQAVHARISDLDGLTVADATVARLLADTIAESE